MAVKIRDNFEKTIKTVLSGEGIAFGTFGELLQGVLPDGDVDFLVTLPISRFSYAKFTVRTKESTIEVFPVFKIKAKKLANRILDYYNLPKGGALVINSEIPSGKGLASSSADLVAVTRAIEECYDIKIPIAQLQSFMSEIEPSDGVMYEGTVSFYHKKVQLHKFLGNLPPLTIVSTDEGGEVDTIEFNKIVKPFTAEDKMEYRQLLSTISTAIQNQDVFTIGKVASRSAILNQKLRPKQSLNELIAICEEIGGLGVVVAHSGTCLGILLSPDNEKYEEQLHTVSERISAKFKNFSIYQSWNEEKGR
ncbi:GHMP family kinase ATP-binding protein [Bacillus pseudomycoides]|uniref:GHMP family kinase ATP-binding protein n=1 Tax=Bacillus pseudomycoides TaxID=64104 RepID=UPI000BEBD398|nr:kinase [Bacillus pseudomycoides]PEE44042.1 kinase [Bacillus pseudomycoides]PEI87008.1 kinase [Bacillus pseudomycoides]PGA85260.1 kinase [Bacillus pseudomycoides]PHF34281.1 kinase [Bacillus pseudomycoides]